MITYFLVFALPVLGLFAPFRLQKRPRDIVMAVFCLVITIFVGLRYQVGGDWSNYLEHFRRIADEGLRTALTHRSIGYGLVNWAVAKISGQVYLVNLICACIFTIGLWSFCRRQPLELLGWVIAFPYLVVVVAMGYTAQSVALGFGLLAFTALDEKKPVSAGLLIGVAIGFHVSAVVLAPLLLMAFKWRVPRSIRSLSARTIVLLGLGGVALMILIWVVFRNEMQLALDRYVFRGQWESQGAYFRVAINFVPGLLLLVFGRKIAGQYPLGAYWYLLSLACVLSPLGLVFSSTLVDRLSIYLTAVQVVAWTRVPMFCTEQRVRAALIFGVVFAYSCSLWVWLAFANHKDDWVPYESILFK